VKLEDRIAYSQAEAERHEHAAARGGFESAGHTRLAEQHRQAEAALRGQAADTDPSPVRSRQPRVPVFLLMDSTDEDHDLRPGGDIAATLTAAMQIADERAGRFVDAAGPWLPDGSTVGIEWQPYKREVPGFGWQHIHPQQLHGVNVVTPSEPVIV